MASVIADATATSILINQRRVVYQKVNKVVDSAWRMADSDYP